MNQVIVIGAGIAGLSTCVRLQEAGIKDILLLEANDRIGGRMNTIPFRKFLLMLNYTVNSQTPHETYQKKGLEA